jgi:hypothetical protein
MVLGRLNAIKGPKIDADYEQTTDWRGGQTSRGAVAACVAAPPSGGSSPLSLRQALLPRRGTPGWAMTGHAGLGHDGLRRAGPRRATPGWAMTGYNGAAGGGRETTRNEVRVAAPHGGECGGGLDGRAVVPSHAGVGRVAPASANAHAAAQRTRRARSPPSRRCPDPRSYPLASARAAVRALNLCHRRTR